MATSAAPRLGIAFTPHLPPERLHALALAADAGGLDELWVWEDCFKESGLAAATAALAWTGRIRVGLGLMPVPLRSVALTAMEIATVDRLFPERFLPGIGHGVQSWMGQAGVRVDSPMTLLREYAVALRALLGGAEVSSEGRYVRLDRVRLDWAPLVPPVLLVGGSGPKALALAGEVGDGTLLGNALNDEELAEACRRTLDAAGEREQPHQVVSTLIAATGPRAQQRVDAEVVKWGAVTGQGVGAAGSAEVIADAVRRQGAAGVTTLVVQATEDEPDLEGFVGFLGREVRPLLG